MPSTYAHYKFAQAVKGNLPADVKKAVDENLDLYLTGCHGPDVLFYYKAIKRNAVNDCGYSMHTKSAKPFFANAKKIIAAADDKAAALAYTTGFITHFALDSECHGYVESKRAESGVSHTKIEVEFDRALLVDDGKNPVKQKLAEHIKAKKEYAQVIAPFFGLDTRTVKRTLKDMKFICNTFVAPGRLKRGFLKKIFTAIGSAELNDQIVSFEPDPRCEDSTRILTEKFNGALAVAAELVENFVAATDESGLCERFERNYE